MGDDQTDQSSSFDAWLHDALGIAKEHFNHGLEEAEEKLKSLQELASGEAGVPEDSPRRAPKSNAEISLEEFKTDLEGAIGNLKKMTTAADGFGADKLGEHIGKIGEGLEAVLEKATELVEVVELVRDIQEFQRALKVARSLDLNRDYEQAAVAMSDLANVGGKLAKKAAGDRVPGLDAYFTLVQNAGEIWKKGAQIRKAHEKELNDISTTDPTFNSGSEADTVKPKVAKKNTGAITPDGVEQFMRDADNAYVDETKWMGDVGSSQAPAWGLATEKFLGAWAELLPLYKKRDAITIGPLSADYRQLGKDMKASYDAAMEKLNYLQDAVGSRDDISVTYEPVLKVMKKVAP